MLRFTRVATCHIRPSGVRYESWCNGDGPDRRVLVASVGARELFAAGTATRDLASRHPGRNEQEGQRKVLPESTAKQQLIPAEAKNRDPRPRPRRRRDGLFGLFVWLTH